jgi:hypothetical protein
MPERDTRVVTVILEDGSEFLMEVSRMEGREKVADEGVFQANSLLNSIKGISGMFARTLTEIGPEKFEIEFGIEVSVKSGKLLALLCNGEGKANLKVKLEWSKKTEK